jgi:hypothetical protein
MRVLYIEDHSSVPLLNKQQTIMLALFIVLGTGTITTMQIQPAYSQATHCTFLGFRNFECVTPGQDSSTKTCASGLNDILHCGPSQDLTHQQAGREIGECHSSSVCLLRPPNE